MVDRLQQQQAAVDEFLDLLRHERRGDVRSDGRPTGTGQSSSVGSCQANDQRGVRRRTGRKPPAPRSTHFLRPVQGGPEIAFRSDVVKAGRTFNLHHVTASQEDKAVVAMSLFVHQRHRRLRVRPVGHPRRRADARDLPEPDDTDEGVGPWDTRWLGPTPERPDGTREATHRHWFRPPRR